MSSDNSNLFCPGINNEKIYFNYAGLKHLIRKGGKTRSIKQVYSRVKLFRYIKDTIGAQSTPVEYRVTNYQENIVEYWGLSRQIRAKFTITVVLRRRNDGRIHFYSIFGKK